jgi:hypothetical protein
MKLLYEICIPFPPWLIRIQNRSCSIVKGKLQRPPLTLDKGTTCHINNFCKKVYSSCPRVVNVVNYFPFFPFFLDCITSIWLNGASTIVLMTIFLTTLSIHTTWPRKPYLRGKLSKVDLIFKIACFVKKTDMNFKC